MFGFISAFFQKVAALVTSALVAVGLVSAPAPVLEPEPPATAILSEQFKEPEVPEPAEPEVKPASVPKPAPKPAPVPVPPPAPVVVPVAPKIQKLTLPSGAVVEIDDNGNIIQSGSAPAPVTPPSSSSQPPLPAGLYRLPSGVIVNEAGNVVNQ